MIDSSKRKKKKKEMRKEMPTNKNDVMDEWRMKALALARLFVGVSTRMTRSISSRQNDSTSLHL